MWWQGILILRILQMRVFRLLATSTLGQLSWSIWFLRINWIQYEFLRSLSKICSINYFLIMIVYNSLITWYCLSATYYINSTYIFLIRILNSIFKWGFPTDSTKKDASAISLITIEIICSCYISIVAYCCNRFYSISTIY